MATLRVTSESNVEDSLAVVQSFCRLMLLNSLAAIPLYLGLLMIAIPFDVNAGVKKGLVLTSPVGAFVVAAVIYAVGFLATLPDGSAGSYDTFSRLRSRTIRQKTQCILFGAGPFLGGILWGTLLLVKAHL